MPLQQWRLAHGRRRKVLKSEEVSVWESMLRLLVRVKKMKKREREQQASSEWAAQTSKVL